MDRSSIQFGDLRRLTPIDPMFGGGRGKPVDRHYIEGFLQRHAADVRGRMLEVGEDHYTRRYGGERVTSAEVLHADRSNPRADWVADLATGDGLPEAAFDGFICTQTLQYVYPLEAAVRSAWRLLRPGGTWLLSVPGISQISPYDRDRWGEHWRFTPQSVQRLLATTFPSEGVEVRAHGNVLAAVAFLHGLACEDLTLEELDHHDDRYPLLVTAAARKPAATAQVAA
ncbi:class I SAM-dependent methyltransferase [Aquabacterium sp. J223]|uniref:class I SAM-dependent methyltransferase n=1 Tax=Aquabacterium sp. J223 TaxID=2898431 RepID=UPI0021AD6CBF|nr:class I SAM-dependent methyltransferase [Aquabacterium sp. J223]UUX94023.1 class I SAM-dependent methyltransferase [Aquabacterium sp. J223]